MNEFGQMLRRLRLEKNITQRELAGMIGVDFTYISKIELGTMEPPAEEKVIKLAEIFGEDPYKFLLMARRIPSEWQEAIIENEYIPTLLRRAPLLSLNQWQEIEYIINS